MMFRRWSVPSGRRASASVVAGKTGGIESRLGGNLHPLCNPIRSSEIMAA